jgi:hypothetical protein
MTNGSGKIPNRGQLSMEATLQAIRVTERGIHIPNIMCAASETDGKIIVIGYLVELFLRLN